MKWGESKGAGRGRKEREEKITFAQSKHRTLQSIIYSPEKKRIGTSSILAWGKSGVGFSTASKSCPDASVEMALTFLLRNTRGIPSRSNSKRLASTIGVKIRIYVRHFWIQNNYFPAVPCKRKRNNQYRLTVNWQASIYFSYAAPIRSSVCHCKEFPKRTMISGRRIFFLPSPSPSTLSFFPPPITLGVTILPLPNLPLS